jgi:ribosomal protein S18 acetylase RimI-like enzyme
VTGRVGDWLLRGAEGFTGRANSALAAGDPGVPLAEAVAQVRTWYAEQGLPAMIAVPFPMSGPEGSAVDRLLDAAGWSLRSGPAIVMTASPAAIAAGAAAREAAPGGAAPVELADSPDEAWLGMYHYRGQVLPPVARRLLMSAPWQAFASVREDGETIAIGRVAADAGWAGLTAIETSARHRRRGLATVVTTALAGLAAQRGVAGLYLQVEAENAAARALYAGMGFADHHRYHYRIASAGQP